MAYPHPERADDDDQARMEKAVVDALAIAVTRLKAVSMAMGGADARFIRNMDLTLCTLRKMPEQGQVQKIKELAWKYRRMIPAGIAPKLPPGDPIVREMEANR
jgi:hypothetical protein